MLPLITSVPSVPIGTASRIAAMVRWDLDERRYPLGALRM